MTGEVIDNPFAVMNRRFNSIEAKVDQLLAGRKVAPASSSSAEPDELLTPEETAQLLKVSKVSIWDWSKKGILKKHTIGNQVRYLRSEVLAAVIKSKKAA